MEMLTQFTRVSVHLHVGIFRQSMAWIILTIAALVLLAASTAALVIRRRALPPTTRAMKQAARDPAHLQAVSERLRRLHHLHHLNWHDVDDRVIQDLVLRLLDADDEEMVLPQQQLEQIGARAEPLLLEALADERFGGEGSAYESVLRLLAGVGSEALVVHLTPQLDSSESERRQLAAVHIAAVGSDTSIDPTLRALADPDSEVRAAARVGIETASSSGRASARFREVLFEALTPLAAGEGGRKGFGAASCLAGLDRERALEMLQSERFLRVGNDVLLDVLLTFRNSGVVIDRELLWPLLDHAKRRGDEYWWTAVHRAVLVQLAECADERTLKEIDDGLESESEAVREGGTEALLMLHGLSEPGDLADAVNEAGYERASEEQRVVAALVALDFEVNNGGYSQYFFNSSGDHWPLALEVARAVGAVHTASQLEQAVAVFGRKGPSIDRDRRLEQYGRLSDETEATLDHLSGQHCEDLDHHQVLFGRYMIANREAISGEEQSRSST